MKLNIYQKICFGYLIALIVFWCFLFFNNITSGFYNYLYSFLFGLIPLLGGILVLGNVSVWNELKSVMGKAVFYLGLGIFLWGCGSLIWSYFNFFKGISAPYPSLADVAFIPSVFFYGLGTFYLSNATGVKYGLKNKFAKVFVIIAPILIFIFSYYILIYVARAGVLISPSGTLLKTIFDVMYPLGDFIALTIAVLVSGLSFKYLGGELKYSVISILLGLIVMFTADTIFSYTTTIGTFYNGDFGDLIYTIGLFLLTFGVLGLNFLVVDNVINNIRHDESVHITGVINAGNSSKDLILKEIILTIIKRQKKIAGQVAWEEAKNVSGIKIIDEEKELLQIEGDFTKVINDLVGIYRYIFGDLSVQISKNAVYSLTIKLPPEEVPESLR